MSQILETKIRPESHICQIQLKRIKDFNVIRTSIKPPKGNRRKPGIMAHSCTQAFGKPREEDSETETSLGCKARWKRKIKSP